MRWLSKELKREEGIPESWYSVSKDDFTGTSLLFRLLPLLLISFLVIFPFLLITLSPFLFTFSG